MNNNNGDVATFPNERIMVYKYSPNKTTWNAAVHNYALQIRNKNNVRCPGGRNNIVQQNMIISN